MSQRKEMIWKPYIGALMLCLQAEWGPAAERAQTARSNEAATLQHRALSWMQSETSLALLNRGHTVWQFNFKKEPGKPCFHPLALLDGTVLTGFRPPDHPWQRALWFSWKYVNHVNYWEEDPNTGISQGETEILQVAVTPKKDFSARIETTLAYHSAGKSHVLVEKRAIEVSPPDAQGCYRIDWWGEFKAAEAEVLLDRVPPLGQPGGQSWGGYAGLTARFAETIRDWHVRNSEGQNGKEAVNGQKARWLDVSADFRGEANTHAWAGIAILDHPDSFRHPTPWQINGNPDIHFLAYMPSFLFHEPYKMLSGSVLIIRYRVVIHPGLVDAQFLNKEWESFAARSKQPSVNSSPALNKAPE